MSVIPVTLRDSFFTDKFFSSAWEDFDKIKQDMLKESREFWERAEKSKMEMRKSMQIEDNSGGSSMLASSGGGNNMMSSSSSTTSSSNNNNSASSSERKSSMAENGSSNIKDIMSNKDLMSDDFFAPWFFPRRWMVPSNMSPSSIDANSASLSSKDLVPSMSSTHNNRMAFPSDFFSSINQDEQVIRTKEDDTKFEVSLDTHDYSPEEIKVNVVGNVISVEAKHEEKAENKFVSRQFSRKYTLPEGCEASRVTSNLSSDGILMITAPKKEVKKIAVEGQRAVPITIK